MRAIIFFLKRNLAFNNFPVLTILANIFLGLALGRIFITSGADLGESVLTKVFLIIGTCFFGNYLLCVRKASQGINRNTNGKLRPFLREAILCAALNAVVLAVSVTLFFLKTHTL